MTSTWKTDMAKMTKYTKLEDLEIAENNEDLFTIKSSSTKSLTAHTDQYSCTKTLVTFLLAITIIGAFLIHGLELSAGYSNTENYQILVSKNLKYRFMNISKEIIEKAQKPATARTDTDLLKFGDKIKKEDLYHDSPAKIEEKFIKEKVLSKLEDASLLKIDEQSVEKSEEKVQDQVQDQFQDQAQPQNEIPIQTTDHHTLQMMCLSGRQGFERRSNIRETWAKNKPNVHYMVGDKTCDLPDKFRKAWTCDHNEDKIALAKKMNAQTFENELLAYKNKQNDIQNKLKNEQGVIMLDMIDSYRNLTLKVKKAYEWMLETYPEAKWFGKADDDQFCRTVKLEKYLDNREKTLHENPLKEFIVIGQIRRNSGVLRSGKWQELDYKKEQGSKARYPPFPIGSAGHVVSRAAAQYMADNLDKLFNYQGEDVSIGIWMDESGHKVKWVTEKLFTNSGKCTNGDQLIVGHNLGRPKFETCLKFGE